MLCGRCAWIQSLSALMESSGSNHAGSGSYSTSISSSACSAIASEVATTQATLSPTYRTLSTASAVSSCPTGRMPYLFGASEPITTVTTPSSASARDASIFLMTACGYGECSILPTSIPGRERSSVYLPWPVVLPAESTSATRLPMMEKSLIAFWVETYLCCCSASIAALIAWYICVYPVQRQRLPLNACLISSSVGSGLRSSNAFTVTMNPGVQ